jgi:hypothetical protein
MIGSGIASLVFEEALDAAPPACLPVVASACWAGWRLLRAPEANLEDVVLGCRRLPQFRDARRASLRREMRWHFRSRLVAWDGRQIQLWQWRAMWEGDAALRRHVEAHPAYAKWIAGLEAAVRRQPRVALAEEAGRSCYGRFGGDPQTLGAMHRFMEEGGI